MVQLARKLSSWIGGGELSLNLSSPPDLPLELGVTHWYDARYEASPSSWTPRVSGSAFAATQAAGANQPTLTTIGSGGHPAFSFDGVDDVLNLLSSKWALGADATFSAVQFVQYVGASGTHGVLNASGPSFSDSLVCFGRTGGGPYFGHRTDGIPGGAVGTSPICQGVTFTGGTATSVQYLNGVVTGSPIVHTAAGASAITVARIGGFTVFASGPLSGKVAHLLIFEGVALTGPQHASMSSFLTGICA